ncbi:MAG: hypothetical protein U9R06_03875 [Patescibacteria group bacterium]|nr:hypothetical protein [Patescibacteria group bacterium]
MSIPDRSAMSGKKLFIFLGIFLFAITILTACVGENQNNKAITRGEFRRPDFGQPDRAPDMMGIVKSIAGNEVVILKIDRPSDEERMVIQEEAGNEATERRSPSLGGSGTIHGTGRGMIGRTGGGDRTEAERIEMMKSRAVGEDKIMIPVGIRMLKIEIGNVADKTLEVIEATLEDVKQDKILNIWLNKDVTDRQLAEFVFVR